jgi:hypothetical protein
VQRNHHGPHVLQETRGLVPQETFRTACYSAVVDKNGECHFGVGDMDINDHITPKLVRFWPVDTTNAWGPIRIVAPHVNRAYRIRGTLA